LTDSYANRPETATLANVYEAIGITDNDHMSICWKPSDTNGEARMRAKIHTRDTAPDFADQQNGDVYFGVNPVDLPVGNRKRGTEKQVTRVVALHADLDVKKDACPDVDTAHLIIDQLSDLIGQRPVGHILSGGGVQPLWALTDCDDATGRGLIRRWGRLVKRVCRERNIKADGVFEVSRMMRVPGTLNHKYDPPRPTQWVPDTGQPMTPEHVTKCLDEHDATVMDDDTQVLSEVISPPSTWKRRSTDDRCAYARKTVDGWALDTPSARHPWTMSALTRLACMQRKGCLTDSAVADARRVIENRLETLCATGDVREPAAHRFDEFWDWAVDRASRQTDGQVERELGNHKHHVEHNSTAEIHYATPTDPNTDDAPVEEAAPERRSPRPGEGTWTDSGNASQLANTCHGRGWYVPRTTKWLRWERVSWRKDADDGRAEYLARRLADQTPIPEIPAELIDAVDAANDAANE
jgi:hypothetical protein